MKYKVLAILWMMVIFISSSIPSADFPEVNWWGWAKFIHLIYFGVLCFLFQRVLLVQNKFPLLARHSLLFALLFVACYGMSDEFHQLFTPGRHAQVTDVLIDTVGACLYAAGAKILEVFRLKRVDAA